MKRIKIRLRTMMIVVAFMALISLVIIQRIDLNRQATLLQMHQSRLDYARNVAERRLREAEATAVQQRLLLQQGQEKEQLKAEEKEKEKEADIQPR